MAIGVVQHELIAGAAPDAAAARIEIEAGWRGQRLTLVADDRDTQDKLRMGHRGREAGNQS